MLILMYIYVDTMNYLDYLPMELLHEIARDSEPAYKSLILAYPRFARAVTPGARIDYVVHFGHNVHVRIVCCGSAMEKYTVYVNPQR